MSDFTGEGIIFVLSNLPSNSIAYLIKTHTRGVPFLCGFFYTPEFLKHYQKIQKKRRYILFGIFPTLQHNFPTKNRYIESNTGSSVIFHSVLVNSTGR